MKDPHQSEYVDHFLNVDNIFQVLLVLPALFLQVPMKDGFGPTGRYFTQTEQQISSDITLMKQRCLRCPYNSLKFLEQNLHPNDVLGTNGLMISASYGKKIETFPKNVWL